MLKFQVITILFTIIFSLNCFGENLFNLGDIYIKATRQNGDILFRGVSIVIINFFP
jgi:hypothetical protein